jgi:hypothetical protein
MWEKIVAERVERELPLPAAADERTRLLRRVTLDLFGEPPTPEETAALVADHSPAAQAALVKRLVQKPGVVPFYGALRPGEIQFRVLTADPEAAKRPRVATGPGWFILGDNQILQVNANKATILFFAPGPKAKAPGKPCEISLPDGRGTYAIAWERGAGVLWIKQKGLVRSYDFTDPAQVKETTFRDPADLAKVPKPILDALPPVLGVPREPPASVSPSVQPDAAGGGAAPDKKASEVLENLKKYDAIFESGFSVSGTEMGRDLLNLRSGASLDVTRRWKLTCDDNRFGYTADVTDHEKTPGRKNIRTKTWGYWGQDLSGYYFEDTLFDANPEGKETQGGKWLHTSLWGPRDARINLSKYVFPYGLGRFFSKDLVKITRVEKRNDGLLVVSALGRTSRITMVPFSSGRWELEIEPTAAWIVRKARFDTDAQPQSTWAGVWTEMTNSGTVWSGPYCIPKEAVINCEGPITKKIETKRLTFDPVVGKFDEKLYSTVRQAVGYNKEPTLTVFDNRVSPETVTEPNRPKPERTQH